MRLKVRFPKVDPTSYELPEELPLRLWGRLISSVWSQRRTEGPCADIGCDEVLSYRYRAASAAGARFRVYPQGVSKGAQQSQRLRAMTARRCTCWGCAMAP